MKYTKIRPVKTPERVGAKITFFVPDDFKALHLGPLDIVRVPLGVMVLLRENEVLLPFSSPAAAFNGLFVDNNIADLGSNGTEELHIQVYNISQSRTLIKPGDKLAEFIVVAPIISEFEEI
jgi:dUTPase